MFWWMEGEMTCSARQTLPESPQRTGPELWQSKHATSIAAKCSGGEGMINVKKPYVVFSIQYIV